MIIAPQGPELQETHNILPAFILPTTSNGMNFRIYSILLALVLSTHAASNQPCGDNKQCESTCKDGKYQTGSEDGIGFYFACELK
jgi:hypothetical protein